jgi:hypothetical protein
MSACLVGAHDCQHLQRRVVLRSCSGSVHLERGAMLQRSVARRLRYAVNGRGAGRGIRVGCRSLRSRLTHSALECTALRLASG